MNEKVHLLESDANKDITHNLVNEGNKKLQDLFDNFDPTIYDLGWYNSLKKYSEIMQRLKDEISSDKIRNYQELNERLNALAETFNDDFLETYLFSSEGKLATISQQLIEHVNREKIRLQVNSEFNLLADVITSNDKREASRLIHVIADQNAWSVLRRFTRALFPAEFTSIDAENHFAVLKKILKADFNIKIHSKDAFDQQTEVLGLIRYQDIYKAQMFFWALKSGYLKSDRVEETQLSYNTNTPTMTQPLNQILYGPPGTGKTYNTINRALEIINDKEVQVVDWADRSAVKELFNKKVDAGQIVFTTFHQSMSYEDFIEGIKPLKPLPSDTFVKYEVTDGIFKLISKQAETNILQNQLTNINKKPFSEAFEQLKSEWEDNNDIMFPLKTEGYDYKIIGFTNTSIQFLKASGGTSHTLSIRTLENLYYGQEYNFKQGVGIYYPSILKRLDSYSIGFAVV